MKPIEWIGSAYDDLLDLPADVQNAIGYGLYLAQIGSKHDDAKPLKGFKGAGVLEIVDDYDGDTKTRSKFSRTTAQSSQRTPSKQL